MLEVASAACRRMQAHVAGPASCRVLQITELVRDCLQQRDANCTILPAPPETCDQDATATILQVSSWHHTLTELPVQQIFLLASSVRS